MIDAVAGLMLLAVIAGVLAASLVRTGRARDRLAGHREAVRSLEAAAAALAAGGPVSEGVRVEAIRASDGAPWLRLAARGRAGAEAELVIPAPPRSALP